MQVPEKLALIGGSILLSSTLIFTLKSQASQIVPHVGHSISNVFDHIGDAQDDSEFGNGYKEAQQKSWTMGTWGTSKYYIDDHRTMHIGAGQIQSGISTIMNNSTLSSLKSISFDQSVKAPSDSGALLNDMPNVEYINGLNKIDTSNVYTINWLFQSDPSLKNVDLSSWDMSHIKVSGALVKGDDNLHTLNISSFSQADWMTGMFDNNSLNQITIGDHFNLGGHTEGLTGKWKAPDGTISDYPSGVHPGTWVKQ